MHFHHMRIWTFIAKCTRAVVSLWKWPELNENVYKQFLNTDLEAKSWFRRSAIRESFEFPCFKNCIVTDKSPWNSVERWFRWKYVFLFHSSVLHLSKDHHPWLRSHSVPFRPAFAFSLKCIDLTFWKGLFKRHFVRSASPSTNISYSNSFFSPMIFSFLWNPFFFPLPLF
jgi:hypothetical protein